MVEKHTVFPKAMVERIVECDESRLLGPIDEAVSYLKEIQVAHPKAVLEKHYYTYDECELRLRWTEPETDEEYQARVDRYTRNAQARIERLDKDAAKEKRRREFEKLKKEFG